jgi:hypothetical protein
MSKNALRKKFGWLLLFTAGILALTVGSCEYRRRSFAHGFEKIQIGDSRQKVVDSMGKPSDGDVETCKPTDDCKDRFLYYSFMARWIVYFDSNDRVSFRVYNGGSF